MLMLRWDGSLWSLDPSPTFNYISVLFSVTATGPDDVWAAGYYYDVGRRRTLTVHWDGAQWSVVPSPNPSDNNTKLTGIAAVAAR